MYERTGKRNERVCLLHSILRYVLSVITETKNLFCDAKFFEVWGMRAFEFNNIKNILLSVKTFLT